MPNTTPSILIIDDEDAIRTSLSLEFQEIGYAVRSAENGFSALFEIGERIPDIVLSDLDMPGMSGVELLSVVRRKFPAIRVIAMSGAFSGSEVPSGVAADAFYQKGSSMRALLQIIRTLPQIKLRPPQPPGTSIQREIVIPVNARHLQAIRLRDRDPLAAQAAPTPGR